MKYTFLITYFSQAYISLIGIIIMPVYLKILGAEAFGLIGFFFMLQAWIQILDLGISPTFSREMSLFKAGQIDAQNACQKLRCLEWILGFLGAVVLLTLFLMSEYIAATWFDTKTITGGEIERCFKLMTATAVIRFLSGLYRAGLIGLEHQILVNVTGMFAATVKFIIILPFLLLVSPSVEFFFWYQTIVGSLEFLLILLLLYAKLPSSFSTVLPKWSALKPMLPVASSMAFMSGVWICLSQFDKLLLSKVLPLDLYGYFALAVMLAGGLLLLITPLNQVLQPRMTILASKGDFLALRKLYLQATQNITSLFIALGGTLSLFSSQILFVWTNDQELVKFASPILFWYSFSNSLIGILSIPFMLQFAYGYLRLHVIGNIILLSTLLPTLIYVSSHFGGRGTGITLLVFNLTFFTIWIPLVHRRLLPEIIWKWPIFHVGKIAISQFSVLIMIVYLLPPLEQKIHIVIAIILSFTLCLFIGLLSGNLSRKIFIKR